MNSPRSTDAGRSVAFFDTQFKRQIAQSDFALNPFESLALAHLRGNVLDYGCGMGNLALRAARSGLEVHALDASGAAITHLQGLALAEGLNLHATQADLRDTCLAGSFDTVICIGLLMFFDCAVALRQLEHLKSLVKPGGTAAVNVLTEGTTYMDMFSPSEHCLFGRDELLARFQGWQTLAFEHHQFPAPAGSIKAFATLIAQRPSS